MNPISLALLVVFGVSVLGTYLAVRRALVKLPVAAVVGSVVDVVVFFFYSLSSGNVFMQALLVGLVLGILFNLMTVVAALYFRQNAVAPRDMP